VHFVNLFPCQSDAKRSLENLKVPVFYNFIHLQKVWNFNSFFSSNIWQTKNILFQATMANIREMRSYLDTTRAENIANFSSALITAFEILHKVSFCLLWMNMSVCQSIWCILSVTWKSSVWLVSGGLKNTSHWERLMFLAKEWDVINRTHKNYLIVKNIGTW
jgi:hypothetical protein